MDRSFNLEDLHANEECDILKIGEQSTFENYEIIDSDSRRVLNRFLRALHSNNTPDIDQLSSQAQVTNDLIEKAPLIIMQNKDRSVRLQSRTRYSVRVFDSVYALTRTTADGNYLYSALLILNIGSENLTYSLRLLAVNAMINNSGYFQTVCKSLIYAFEEQLERTAENTTWGGEVQVLSIARFHPIYSYNQFNNNPNKPYYAGQNCTVNFV